MKRLVIDLDHTITSGDSADYAEVSPQSSVVTRLREYKAAGFEIVIHTSRSMRSYEGNIGKIVAHTTPTIIAWLQLHDVPYDEIWVGKPWCGTEGFYVDDKAIRPDEFEKLSYEEIKLLTSSKRET